MSTLTLAIVTVFIIGYLCIALESFTVGSHDETIEEYVNRALKEAAKQNIIEEAEETLTKKFGMVKQLKV